MFPWILIPHPIFFFFFFNDTATTEIYTLSLHDALPIYRDLVAADGAQLGGAERQQVPPLEFDQAAREDVPRRLRDEPQDRERRHDLAAPRLPDDAEGLAGMDVEGHAVNGARRAAAALGDEVRLEIAHAQQGLRHAVSWPGSRASRSASPTAVSAITTTAMASPGNSEVHGAVPSWSLPSAIMFPQLGTGDGTPMPRNDRLASSSMTLPMPSAADTISGAATLGRTWRRMMRAGRAPSARAAATNSRSRSDRTSARTRRLVPNHPVSPITSTR